MRAIFCRAVLFSLLLFPQAIFASDLNLPEGFASWKSARAARFSAVQLDRIAAGDDDVLREYGAEGAEQRSYTSREQHLTATLYRFRDPSGAYGMFTFWQAADMDPLRITGTAGSDAARNDRRLLAFFGSYLLDIQGSDLAGLREIELREMIAGLARRAREPAILPSLPSYLPRQGILEGSERYVLGLAALERLYPLKQGDWIGFGYGAEVELARYQLGERTETLLLALYPTPQMAIERSRDLGRYFTVNEEKPRGNLPVAFYKRAGPLVALVLDSEASGYANFLLDRVDYRWDVTWSERASRKDEPGWYQMLVTIFFGTGLLLAFTLIASLAFAGFRVLISTYLPGRVFDRPSASEIIQLHLDRK